MVFIHVQEETIRRPGGTVIIQCPACGDRTIPASTYDQEVNDRLFGLILLKTTRSTTVVCSNCRAQLASRVSAAELQGKTPEELADLLVPSVSFIGKALAILAVIMAVVPLIGTVMAGMAIMRNWKSLGWPKTLSYIALGLSFAALPVLWLLDRLGIF